MADAPEVLQDGAWAPIAQVKGAGSDRVRLIRVQNVAFGERSVAIDTEGFDKANVYVGESFVAGGATATVLFLGQIPATAIEWTVPTGLGFASSATITTGGVRTGGYVTQLPMLMIVGHASTGWTMDIVVELRVTKVHSRPGDH